MLSLALAEKIFLSGVEAVLPGNLVKNHVSRSNAHIVISDRRAINLDDYDNVYVVGELEEQEQCAPKMTNPKMTNTINDHSKKYQTNNDQTKNDHTKNDHMEKMITKRKSPQGFGKAVLGMAEELLPLLHGKCQGCILSVPVGARQAKHPLIQLFRGAQNNVPDDDAFKAAQRIVEVTSSCSPRDLLFVLISGGGSSLLPFPKPPITLAEKSALVKELSRNGADIQELNVVRKKISVVKGGGLLNLCGAAEVISLILSDVLGDDLGIIASGPTFLSPAQTDVPTAFQVVQKLITPISRLSQNILSALKREDEPIKKDRENRISIPHVTNVIIGKNTIALRGASAAVTAHSSLTPIILTSMLDGEARTVGEKIAQLCHLIGEELLGKESFETWENSLGSLVNDLCIPPEALSELSSAVFTFHEQKRCGLCLLFGGETTVKVKGSGRGGRNQELALSAALTLHRRGAKNEILICSAGTDGIDGPCDAAGAIVTNNTISQAKAVGLEGASFLENNDSYHFFKSLANGRYHLVTGHTETNVMDIVIAIVTQNPIHDNALRSSL